MGDLKVVYVDIENVIPYENNPRINDDAVEKVANSIREFGWQQPIVVDKHNVIIVGHTRLKAAQMLGEKQVPVVFADLSDELAKSYRLADNKTGELARWDFEVLEQELSGILDVDMSEFGFLQEDGEVEQNDEENENPYTTEVNIPQYEPTGEYVDITDLVDIAKSTELIERIKNSSVSKQEKQFLVQAAYRHNIFNYKKIAEYYANASEDMQELMEDSALVIIDVNDAIAKGYATLRDEIEEIAFDE